MKRIIISLILAAIVIGSVAWTANYLSSGTITIKAGKDDTISLQKTSGDQTFTKIAIGSLKSTVKHGRYTATVKNGVKTTVQIINFNSGHKNWLYSVKLANLQPVETVSYQSALSVAANSNQLVYLDTASTVHKIDNQNNLQQIDKNHRFKTVEWANPSFGVGEGDDERLYTISGTSISPLRVPFTYSGKSINFDVSPDQKIYISYGADVYAASQSGDFKKIYVASSSRPTLSASVSGVAVSDPKYGARSSNVSRPLLAVINAVGKVTKKNIEAERIAWSPNGQSLAIVNQGSPVIYDPRLHQTAVVPTPAVVGHFQWLNNGTFSYTTSYQFWTYDLAEQKIQLLADAPATDSINGIYYSNGEAYAYITTLNSFSSTYAIKRIDLKGQTPPDYVLKLEGVLPQILPTYTLNLVNFSQPPAVFVQPSVDSPPGNYIQAAQGQLKDQGIDTAPLKFELGPTSGGN